MSEFIANAELRIEAERLCDENDQLKAENAKLRELALEIWRSCPVSEDDCAKCSHHLDESDEVWCDIPILMERQENRGGRMTFDHPFHIRLQRIMYDKDISQSELARRVGVGRSCMHNWYWGIRNPSIEALKRIRRALGCEWDELMGR